MLTNDSRYAHVYKYFFTLPRSVSVVKKTFVYTRAPLRSIWCFSQQRTPARVPPAIRIFWSQRETSAGSRWNFHGNKRYRSGNLISTAKRVGNSRDVSGVYCSRRSMDRSEIMHWPCGIPWTIPSWPRNEKDAISNGNFRRKIYYLPGRFLFCCITRPV